MGTRIRLNLYYDSADKNNGSNKCGNTDFSLYGEAIYGIIFV